MSRDTHKFPIGRNVFIGRLSDRTRDRDLQAEFDKFGKIEKVVVKQGFGFVEFEKNEDAEAAVKAMNGKSVDGNQLIVELAQGERPRAKSKINHTEWRVRLENLSSSCHWKDIKDLFRREYVTFVDVYDDGTGVAEFERHEDMKKAIRHYDGSRFQGRTLSVREDRARGRSDRYKPYRSRSRERRSKSKERKTDRKSKSPPPKPKEDRDAKREREDKQDNRSDNEDNGKISPRADA